MLDMFKKKKLSQIKPKKNVDDKNFSLIASVISIIVGLTIGFLLLFILEFFKAESNFEIPFIAMKGFLAYAFTSYGKIILVFYKAAPIILTGLAVGFAFKAGLFNIGASGQAAVGGFFALIAVILWNFPWWAAILVALICGALWGFIPGLFKAQFNINEVITTIMLNWTSVYFISLLLHNLPNMRTLPPWNKTDPIIYHNPSGLLPDLGLQDILGTSFINVGIIIAIVIAIIIHILLNKTTFGFEVKACGHNKNASIYAGIKAKRTIILTMVISGGIAGIAGAIFFLAGTVQFNFDTGLLSMGFDGIPVALLASSGPLGIIISGIFVGYLQAGSQAFQGFYAPEVMEVILSIIIYFSAFALIVGQFINKRRKRHNIDDTIKIIPVIESKEDTQDKDKPLIEDSENKEVSN